MTLKKSIKSKSTAENTSITPEPCPWMDIDASGMDLDVFNFPTTLMSIVGAALRRTVTLPYVDGSGLTFAEWKILSVLAHGKTFSFIEIETLSATDKSLVSKTLRLLESRGLVTIKDRGHSGKKQLTSTITPEGQAVNDKVIRTARRSQARLLLMLEPEERAALYRALSLWHGAYTGQPLPSPDNI